MTSDSQILSTTKTTLRVLEVIQIQERATVRRISNEMNLGKSTVYKHLKTLEQEGFVEKTGNEYYIGARLYEFGMSVRNRNQIYELARKYTIKLADRTNEEADFGIESNGRLVTIYDVLGNSSISTARDTYYQYLHATAIGKCILSTYPEKEIDRIIERWGLQRVTENTITSREKLLEDINSVREKGYAVNNQESRLGKRAVGVGVEYPPGNVIGGFSVCGPEYRLDDSDLRQLSNDITEIVDDLESEISDPNL